MKFISSVLFLLSFSLHLHSQNFEIYISDAGNFNNPPWQILKFDSAGTSPVSFINSHLNWPQDILFLEDSNVVLISNLGSDRISRYNAQTGAFINNFATAISGPTRMKIGPDGLLYVLQWRGNGLVKRYQLDGSFVDDFTSVPVNQSIGLDWDDDKNLYVSSYNLDLVRKFDSTGADLGIFINSNLAGPTNIWFDDSGDLLVSDYDGGSLKRFDSSGTFLGVYISGLGNSEGFAYLPNGNLLLGNGATRSVKMYDSNGSFIKDIIPAASGSLLNPNAVVIRFKNDISTIEEVDLDLGLNFMYPSIGSLFQVEEKLISAAESVEIRDGIGRLIYHSKSLNWNAQSIANGNYIAILKMTNGQKFKQKIEVKN